MLPTKDISVLGAPKNTTEKSFIRLLGYQLWHFIRKTLVNQFNILHPPVSDHLFCLWRIMQLT